jgi:hypothetical protein
MEWAERLTPSVAVLVPLAMTIRTTKIRRFEVRTCQRSTAITIVLT